MSVLLGQWGFPTPLLSEQPPSLHPTLHRCLASSSHALSSGSAACQGAEWGQAGRLHPPGAPAGRGGTPTGEECGCCWDWPWERCTPLAPARPDSAWVGREAAVSADPAARPAPPDTCPGCRDRSKDRREGLQVWGGHTVTALLLFYLGHSHSKQCPNVRLVSPCQAQALWPEPLEAYLLLPRSGAVWCPHNED